MREPEPGISDVGTFQVQAIDGAPDLAQQGRAVDLGLELFGIELLDRAGDRTQRRDMRSGGFPVDPAEPMAFSNETGRARGSWVEVVLEVEVGPAEVVDR